MNLLASNDYNVMAGKGEAGQGEEKKGEAYA